MGRHLGEMDDRITLSPRHSATALTGFELRPDGLMVPTYRPRRRRGSRRMLRSLRGLLAVAIAVTAFKVLIFAQVGAAGYADRLSRFGDEEVASRAIGFVMQADPLTVALGSGLRRLMAGSVIPVLDAAALD